AFLAVLPRRRGDGVEGKHGQGHLDGRRVELGSGERGRPTSTPRRGPPRRAGEAPRRRRRSLVRGDMGEVLGDSYPHATLPGASPRAPWLGRGWALQTAAPGGPLHRRQAGPFSPAVAFITVRSTGAWLGGTLQRAPHRFGPEGEEDLTGAPSRSLRRSSDPRS